MTQVILVDENNKPIQSYTKRDGLSYVVVVSPVGSVYVKKYKPVRVRY